MFLSGKLKFLNTSIVSMDSSETLFKIKMLIYMKNGKS